MYRPKFNHVLVEIDDKLAKWGKSDDGNIGGEVYREGKVIEVGKIMPTQDYPFISNNYSENLNYEVASYKDKQVMWNEGHEAGTVFEEGGKKYALIYWWDIIGVKDESWS